MFTHTTLTKTNNPFAEQILVGSETDYWQHLIKKMALMLPQYFAKVCCINTMSIWNLKGHDRNAHILRAWRLIFVPNYVRILPNHSIYLVTRVPPLAELQLKEDLLLCI